jgi:hypothetical protein
MDVTPTTPNDKRRFSPNKPTYAWLPMKEDKLNMTLKNHFEDYSFSENAKSVKSRYLLSR